MPHAPSSRWRRRSAGGPRPPADAGRGGGVNAPLLRRIGGAGLIAAIVVLIAGRALERVRFGASDEAAQSLVEAEVRQRFDASAEALGALASRIAPRTDTITAAARDPAETKRLFEAADAALPDQEAGRTGITIYNLAAAPLAWAGRVSELPRERIDGPAALFVAPGALGPRLVRVEPVVDRSRANPQRLATIVVEQSLGRAGASPTLADTFTIQTSRAPVALRLRVGGSSPAPRPFTFVIPSRGGGLLVEAEVSPADLAEARAGWRRGTVAAVESVIAITLLIAVGPLVDARRRSRRPRVFLVATGVIALALVAARVVFWFALAPILGPRSPISPADLVLTTLLLLALIWIALDLVERRRYTQPRPRLLRPGAESIAILGPAYAAAGVADVWLLWSYGRALRVIVSRTTLDLLHFSLHPLNVTRLGVAFGLVLLHAAVIWTAAAILRLPALLGRPPHRLAPRIAILGWLSGIVLALVAIRPPGTVPIAPLAVAIGSAGLCASALAAMRSRARRASQAARLGVLFLALLVPALATYPSLVAFATSAKERLVADAYGPEAASQRTDLKERLREALDEIDAMPALADFVAGAPEVAAPTTDRAFAVWSATDLATYRLTSAVELYGAQGSLVSRFALNLPEYAATTRQAAACSDWDLLEEVSPFGSSERRVLRASRGLCDARNRALGAIVVRVMLDYTTLPFISSPSPYLESLRPERTAQAEGVSGRDVEFVVYGWSRAPIFASGTSTWALPDSVFDRLVASRERFWARITRDGEDFRVYFLSDRGGIYALGYPVITGFGHLINLAELITLTFALFAALLAGATLLTALTSHTPASGRALLREIRRSFYSKLFLAFLAGAVVPVVILAVATRAYFASQLNASVQESAGKTARVAQRLVEDYATLQRRGSAGGAGRALPALDDQVMLLVRIAIDQDVNLFERTQLAASSERELFASGLLSPRTPGDVYQRIVLDRLPTYVGVEQVGDVPYLLAAAPVLTGGREGIVTVPVALRQQEIERQKDELDRRVLFGAVLFILIGGGLGYWMAERIADPVSRLTRATRRIARGDLDARIASTSSDELRRLVDDFNQMAADLKRQRTELERTQRLEAWADMARQVAHDIKNPLTPIQLSAEHARRINLDRGRPLSPVLDDCVSAILSQVKLLRQISAEFSSFASSPTPRPEATHLPALVEEVVEPYRAGLAGRITITTDAPADLPAIAVDRTLFARALTNVIENALHAMPGGGRLDISVHAAAESGAGERRSDGVHPRAVVVRVADTGIGMDPESTAKIFEPYFSTKAAGTGLGLTIAKRNIELNGGTIHVTSERGVGTTVTLTLPADPVG
jgi:signal transduction histidine kinase